METDLASPSDPWIPSTEGVNEQSQLTSLISPTQRPLGIGDGQPQAATSTLQNRKMQNNWNDTEFEPLEENPGGNNSKLEEAKKKREERKLMRQKELEARRANRALSGSGPMKLGAKKI